MLLGCLATCLAVAVGEGGGLGVVVGDNARRTLLFDPDSAVAVFVGHFVIWVCVLGGFYTSGKSSREQAKISPLLPIWNIFPRSPLRPAPVSVVERPPDLPSLARGIAPLPRPRAPRRCHLLHVPGGQRGRRDVRRQGRDGSHETPGDMAGQNLHPVRH